jgi:hypothetical protein
VEPRHLAPKGLEVPLTGSNRPLASCVTRKALTDGSDRLLADPAGETFRSLSPGLTFHGQGCPAASWLRRNSRNNPRTPDLVPRTPRCDPRSPFQKEERYGELSLGNKDTSSLAFRHRPAFHQRGACCDARHELEHSLSAALDQRQDALGRRLPPTLKRTSTHALVIPVSYPEVALGALPGSLPVHASLPAVTDPGVPG